MSKSLPPLTWFRAFEAASRHLSFTLAADELGLTQSAISQHVRALEERLGTQLFVRGHRALVLTEAGRLLVPDVAAAMSTLKTATQRFLPETRKPSLTIATSDSIVDWILAPNIAGFQSTYPDVIIQLETAIWPDDFVSIDADIEIRFGPPSVVGHEAQRLSPNHLHAVAAPSIAAQINDWTDVSRFPLIQPVGLSLGWADLGRTQQPAMPLDHSFLVDTHGIAVNLAKGGAGIALCHGLISRQAVEDGSVSVLPFGDFEAQESHFLAKKPTAQPELQLAFESWFLQLLA